MSRRGPRPTPTYLKLLRGNPGHRPLNQAEPSPLTPPQPPEPPESLHGYAREEWYRIITELYRLQLVTIVDVRPLAAYCEAYGTWRLAVDVLNKMIEKDPVMNGLMVKSAKGTIMQNPVFMTVRQAADQMVRFASEFGFTPAARSRISITEAQRTAGKFDGLLGGGD